jgi:hypothetical protein
MPDTTTSPLFSLDRLDVNPIENNPAEVRLFCVARNEQLRLPAFLEYYRQKGVDRFFVVDNDSTDATKSLLLEASDVHLFHTTARYSEGQCGIIWVRRLLDKYGIGHWCLVADIDELFYYPNIELLSIPELCRYLDETRSTAVGAILVDMYSAKPFCETDYRAGGDLIATCPYFDSRTIYSSGRCHLEKGGLPYCTGGMRERLFGVKVTLNKMSLFKYRPPMVLGSGMHSLSMAIPSRVKGAVLHFKYLSDFAFNVTREVDREEHWQLASEYKAYRDRLRAEPQLSAYCPSSVLLQSSSDLIACRLMQTVPEFDGFARQVGRPTGECAIA